MIAHDSTATLLDTQRHVYVRHLASSCKITVVHSIKKSHQCISIFRAAIAEDCKIWKKFDIHDLFRHLVLSFSCPYRKDDQCGESEWLKTSKKKMNVIIMSCNKRTMLLNLKIIMHLLYNVILKYKTFYVKKSIY